MQSIAHLALSFRLSRFLCAVLPTLVVATALQAQDPELAPDSLAASSRSSVGAVRGETVARRFARLGNAAADLQRVYGDGEWAMLWSRDGAATASARATIEALYRIDERGLDPADYDVDRLRKLADLKLRSDSERSEFDATLTVAALRALRALHGGRVVATDSGSLRPLVATSATDYSGELRAMASSKTPAAVLDAAEPVSEQYRMLKATVSIWRLLARTDTVARRNLSRILLTLERERMLRQQDGGPSIVVNIPEFRLRAQVDGGEADADAVTMDVVVGGAARYRTPVMSDTIEYIVFAPYWEVPASIVRSELLPIAMRDPYLLTTNHYQIVDRRGRPLPATAASVKQVKAGRARIRQLPGGTNSLGRVKFMFPNADDVYLHDTPLSSDFARTRRDRSHGCVRVADPAALARLLLRDQPEWTAEAIESAMNGSTPVTVKLTRPVPVHLTYATAVARDDGTVAFFDDIYGLDAALARQLAMAYLYR